MSAGAASVPAGEGKAYRELGQIVRERGWLEKAPGRLLTELGIHLALHLGGIALFLAVDNLWVRVAALAISAYGGLGVATNTHTSSHNATSRSMKLNRALTYFGYTFLFGTAAHFWWNKHCVVHHPAPNIIEVDDDADLMPFFVLNERELQESRGFARFFYRIQWIFIPLVLALNTFFTQFQGYRYLLPILADPKRRRPSHWIDLGVLALHILTWIVVPMLFFPPSHVLGFYALRNALMGYLMFAAFAPAHYPAEAVFIDKSQLADDYVLRQTATTVNFRTGFFGRLACSGVDYQIEHHLFPGVPHHYYPEMSRVIEEYCLRHGYPYRTLGWWESIWKSLVVFYRPKKVFDEVAAFRVKTV
ncbi:MAG: acyl-CoA desaturase [Thermoanaerobaculia bacterium]